MHHHSSPKTPISSEQPCEEDPPLASHCHDAHHVLRIAVDLRVEYRLCAVELRRPARQAVVGVDGEARVVEEDHRGFEHGDGADVMLLSCPVLCCTPPC